MTHEEKSKLKAIEHHKARLKELREQKEIDLLSIEEMREIKIQLSWGGPGDGFKLYYTKEGELSHGYYYFEDWFFYKEFSLDESDLAEVEQAFGISGLII